MDKQGFEEWLSGIYHFQCRCQMIPLHGAKSGAEIAARINAALDTWRKSHNAAIRAEASSITPWDILGIPVDGLEGYGDEA